MESNIYLQIVFAYPMDCKTVSGSVIEISRVAIVTSISRTTVSLTTGETQDYVAQYLSHCGMKTILYRYFPIFAG